jgi:hypothetical protein
MTTEELLRHARRAVDELRAGRQTKLPPMSLPDSMRVVSAVKKLLAGQELVEDTPD